MESLQEQLARLERERDDADRRYNEALTALDRAIARDAPGPTPLAPYDPQRLADVNQHWNILADGRPSVDRSLKGRLRGFIWRLVGPALERQLQFNSAIVDHLNRNVASHEETAHAVAALTALADAQAEARARVEAHLIQYLQTITWYVDTKDRAAAAGAQVLNAALSAITDDWLKRWESMAVREHRFLDRAERLAQGVDDVRSSSAIAQQTALSLKRDVERLFAANTSPEPTGGRRPARDEQPAGADAPRASSGPVDGESLDSFKYLGFENAFRGSQEEIRTRLTSYLPLFADASDVLEIGCGRGEFLGLLREAGVAARGLDSNQAMVEEARARGLDVVRADALEHLTRLDDGSLGGLFAAQVVEHLPPDYLSRLLEVAAHKLRPGSLIVLETINPSCWVAFFESYIRDLTHVRPLHPETLQYLLRVNGFQDVRLEFKAPVAEDVRLRPLPASAGDDPDREVLVDTFNRNVKTLNDRMFSYQDFAAIGRR